MKIRCHLPSHEHPGRRSRHLISGCHTFCCQDFTQRYVKSVDCHSIAKSSKQPHDLILGGEMTSVKIQGQYEGHIELHPVPSLPEFTSEDEFPSSCSTGWKVLMCKKTGNPVREFWVEVMKI